MTNENDFSIKVFSENKNIINLDDIIKWQGKLKQNFQ